MECVEMRYVFKDERDEADEATEIRVIRRDKDSRGLTTDEVCTMFMELMDAAGFSTENVMNFFNPSI